MNDSEFDLNMNLEIEGSNLSVIGVGRMGCGIALSFAYAGYPITLVDSEDRSEQRFAELVAATLPLLQADLDFLKSVSVISEQQSTEILARISIVPKANAASYLQQADFIFEAVSEVVEIKKSTYAWLNDIASEKAIFASTTSTMLANKLAEFVRDSSRFSNAHWLNPAYLMPLIEISPSQGTSDETVTKLKTLFEKMGKKPIVCAASPGYIVSRLQALALNESARMVEEGVASAEDIDNAVRYGFGIRYAILGMLEFVDWGGGDILYYACNYLADNIDQKRFAPADIVKQNMENHRNGLRDGVGFYEYEGVDLDAYRNRKLAAFVNLLKHLELMPRAK
ncbi:MAG: 3-hydroxybutyryl-CoA dehydrogenase [Pseudomonadales bacterium]